MLYTFGNKAIDLDQDRADILAMLTDYTWWNATAPEIQIELMELPSNWDGFLLDLASRSHEFDGVDVLHIHDISYTGFSIRPRFWVRNAAGNEYAYEYTSWKQGPASGSKGIVVFVDEQDRPISIGLLSGMSFAIGQRVYDLAGGFKELISLALQMVTEISEEFGIPVDQLQIVDEPISLGAVHMDPGMTNNTPEFFVVKVRIDPNKVNLNPVNPDPYELKRYAVIVPIDEVADFMPKAKNAMFYTTIALAVNQGLLPVSCLVRSVDSTI